MVPFFHVGIHQGTLTALTAIKGFRLILNWQLTKCNKGNILQNFRGYWQGSVLQMLLFQYC